VPTHYWSLSGLSYRYLFCLLTLIEYLYVFLCADKRKTGESNTPCQKVDKEVQKTPEVIFASFKHGIIFDGTYCTADSVFQSMLTGMHQFLYFFKMLSMLIASSSDFWVAKMCYLVSWGS
jgi:hypothetical protein